MHAFACDQRDIYRASKQARDFPTAARVAYDGTSAAGEAHPV